MIRNLFIIIIFCCVVKNSFAQFHAVCVPAEKMNTIKIDGHINEWNWVPENYWLQTDVFFERINNLQPDTTNFALGIIVAWNELTNRIYIAAKVKDKSIVDGERLNVAVNPGNSEGHYWVNGATAHHNVMNYYIQLKDGDFISDLFLGPEWAKSSEFLEWAVKVNENDSVIFYEMSFPLWEVWSHKGPEYSKEFSLHSNQSIGILLALTNKNSDSKSIHKWISVYEQNCWYDARSIANQFILDPYVSKDPGWDAIKYVLE